jgi:hypothetical protein
MIPNMMIYFDLDQVLENLIGELQISTLSRIQTVHK